MGPNEQQKKWRQTTNNPLSLGTPNNFSRSHAPRGNAEAPRRGVSRRLYKP